MKHDEDLLKKFNSSDFFWIVPIIIMVIGIFPMPIGYYTLLRIVVFVCSIFFCFKIYEHNNDIGRNHELWFFVIIALIYNPIFPVYLYVKIIWTIINLITCFLFYKYKNLINERSENL